MYKRNLEQDKKQRAWSWETSRQTWVPYKIINLKPYRGTLRRQFEGTRSILKQCRRMSGIHFSINGQQLKTNHESCPTSATSWCKYEYNAKTTRKSSLQTFSSNSSIFKTINSIREDLSKPDLQGCRHDE